MERKGERKHSEDKKQVRAQNKRVDQICVSNMDTWKNFKYSHCGVQIAKWKIHSQVEGPRQEDQAGGCRKSRERTRTQIRQRPQRQRQRGGTNLGQKGMTWE